MKHDEENREIWELLDADTAPTMNDSAWPGIIDAVRKPRRNPLLPRLVIAGGGLAAVAAGLLLGLSMGDVRVDTAETTAWWEEGSLLIEDNALTLDAFYGELFDDESVEGE